LPADDPTGKETEDEKDHIALNRNAICDGRLSASADTSSSDGNTDLAGNNAVAANVHTLADSHICSTHSNRDIAPNKCANAYHYT
jgi:hypothetical protein